VERCTKEGEQTMDLDCYGCDDPPNHCLSCGGSEPDQWPRALDQYPPVYREQATFHTDQYDVYKGIIPAEQYRAITKKARKTNHIERFNTTLRQRVARLVRATLSFSKKLANHIGAIKHCICHYNLEKAAALLCSTTRQVINGRPGGAPRPALACFASERS